GEEPLERAQPAVAVLDLGQRTGGRPEQRRGDDGEDDALEVVLVVAEEERGLAADRLHAGGVVYDEVGEIPARERGDEVLAGPGARAELRPPPAGDALHRGKRG
ncbi:MAG: hypothetical protein ACK559_05705, partial [bacterium]